MPMRWRLEYSVRGSGDFPIDMLRYDRSSPQSSEDAGMLLVTPRDLEVYTTPRTIRLVMFTETQTRGGPTIDRWKSFGWAVQFDSFAHIKI